MFGIKALKYLSGLIHYTIFQDGVQDGGKYTRFENNGNSIEGGRIVQDGGHIPVLKIMYHNEVITTK